MNRHYVRKGEVEQRIFYAKTSSYNFYLTAIQNSRVGVNVHIKIQNKYNFLKNLVVGKGKNCFVGNTLIGPDMNK